MEPTTRATCLLIRIQWEEQTEWAGRCIMITIIAMDINRAWPITTKEVIMAAIQMLIRAVTRRLPITINQLSTTIVLIEMKGKPMLLTSNTGHIETLTSLIKGKICRIAKARTHITISMTRTKTNIINGSKRISTSSRINIKIWLTINNLTSWVVVIIWIWKTKQLMANMLLISNSTVSISMLILNITNIHNTWCRTNSNLFVKINLARS